MSAWQRQIRDKEAALDPRPVVGLETAEVRLISPEAAQKLIVKYEWLGNTGTSQYNFGLFLENELAGVACFGSTAGTNVRSSVCGPKQADKVVTLVRGACVHWAHQHSASYLISQACRQMTEKGFNIFVAYADPDADEIGTVYQACNWFYCGKTSSVEMLRIPDGKLRRDCRAISASTRLRSNRTVVRDPISQRVVDMYFEFDGKKYRSGDILPDGGKVKGGKFPYIAMMSRVARKQQLEAAGYTFESSTPKHRYVGIYTDKRTRRAILKDMKTSGWTILEDYPKRAEQLQGAPSAPPEGGAVRACRSAPKFYASSGGGSVISVRSSRSIPPSGSGPLLAAAEFSRRRENLSWSHHRAGAEASTGARIFLTGTNKSDIMPRICIPPRTPNPPALSASNPRKF